MLWLMRQQRHFKRVGEGTLGGVEGVDGGVGREACLGAWPRRCRYIFVEVVKAPVQSWVVCLGVIRLPSPPCVLCQCEAIGFPPVDSLRRPSTELEILSSPSGGRRQPENGHPIYYCW
ncbi:hypothetical protein BC938DRAFT_472959 [Jimgerdemannia flammicorona]|uniref:Uncharacterized protein n=1 Tax=Jimgerdemannia flammicorona TaxID=994334 RepID=A0A433Q523_9FUNG|nr:hypothetical protein BC938DRAFT_472959 [Jimgerdemannia flammicorona]